MLELVHGCLGGIGLDDLAAVAGQGQRQFSVGVRECGARQEVAVLAIAANLQRAVLFRARPVRDDTDLRAIGTTMEAHFEIRWLGTRAAIRLPIWIPLAVVGAKLAEDALQLHEFAAVLTHGILKEYVDANAI